MCEGVIGVRRGHWCVKRDMYARCTKCSVPTNRSWVRIKARLKYRLSLNLLEENRGRGFYLDICTHMVCIYVHAYCAVH